MTVCSIFYFYRSPPADVCAQGLLYTHTHTSTISTRTAATSYKRRLGTAAVILIYYTYSYTHVHVYMYGLSTVTDDGVVSVDTNFELRTYFVAFVARDVNGVSIVHRA